MQADKTQFTKANIQRESPMPIYLTSEEQECLQSLYFNEMHWRRDDVVDAAPTTCAWLMEHTTYCKWLAEGHGLLWIKGNPGTGKSTVLKHTLESAEREAEQNCILASFFFHGRGAPIQKDVLGLFRSLLHQILQQNRDLLCVFTSIYKKKCSTQGRFGSDWNWNKNELQTFFRSNVVDTARTHQMRIYIDALDESGQDIALELVEFFRVFAASVPICFTCRHYPFVSLEGGNEICVEDRNEQDIKTYVQDKIGAHIQRTDIAEAIRNEIVSRSRRNFQWVVLVIPRVLNLYKSRKSIVAIQKMIRDTPAELDELYTELLSCIEEDERFQSLHFMQWICFAFRPLKIKELRFALAVDPNTSDTSIHQCLNSELYMETDEDMKLKIYDLSKGLAEVLDCYGGPIVQFIHQSVQDFLLEKGFRNLDSSIAGTVIGHGHLWLSRSCIKYLSIANDLASSLGLNVDYSSGSHKMEDGNRFDLVNYAAYHWLGHVRKVGNANMSEDDLATLDAKALGRRSRSRFGIKPPYLTILYPTTLLHVAADCNFISMVNAILNQNVWADQTDGSGLTPLSIAAGSGYLVVVEILLRRNDVDANHKDAAGYTPLALAAVDGHEAVVEMLMNRDGVDVDSKNMIGETPLALAAARGHEAVVKALLKRVVNAGSKDRCGRTPLHRAAENGHYKIVKLLLQHNADPNAKDNQNGTPLTYAASNGSFKVVKLLLQYNADPNSRDSQNRTPLSYGPSNEYKAVRIIGGASLLHFWRSFELSVRASDIDVNPKIPKG